MTTEITTEYSEKLCTAKNKLERARIDLVTLKGTSVSGSILDDQEAAINILTVEVSRLENSHKGALSSLNDYKIAHSVFDSLIVEIKEMDIECTERFSKEDVHGGGYFRSLCVMGVTFTLRKKRIRSGWSHVTYGGVEIRVVMPYGFGRSRTYSKIDKVKLLPKLVKLIKDNQSVNSARKIGVNIANDRLKKISTVCVDSRISDKHKVTVREAHSSSSGIIAGSVSFGDFDMVPSLDKYVTVKCYMSLNHEKLAKLIRFVSEHLTD